MRFINNIISLINREIPLDKLKKRGLKVGNNFSKQQGCFIDPTHCFLIEIGNNVTFSIRVVLLAHDASSCKLIEMAKIGKIIIRDNVFIGANATILPNVEIGENSIIGAGSVVTKSIPPNSVVAGIPARVISTVDEYKEKLQNLKTETISFGEEYTMRKNVDEVKKQELKEAVNKHGICFIM